MLDLHTHSTFSDGTDTPAELVQHARAAGLRALALTDHDNMRGLPVFFAACLQARITGLAGVEISAQSASGTLHLLGLGFDPAHRELNAALERVLAGREERNRVILGKLRALGLDLSWEEVAALAGGEVVVRTHFAQALMARGWVKTAEEAFTRYLGKGAPAYTERYRLDSAEAVRLIHAAGGVTVMAHPCSCASGPVTLADRVRDLRALGLDGIEAYYPEHSQELTIECLRLARRHDLLITGGSDYHGRATPGRRLGVASGGQGVPEELLAPLLKAIGPGAGVHLET
ncbi:MAG: PHP domain-containing protein [Kiritimatiellae bacterium]|nr:PHP domain-containing protein [Kiritimatiellia bacterium]